MPTFGTSAFWKTEMPTPDNNKNLQRENLHNNIAHAHNVVILAITKRGFYYA